MAMQEELVRDTLQAAGGEIVGRIRLQKIFYFLEQFGLDSGFNFSYYHYGPYSEEISATVLRARFADKIVQEIEKFTAYGTPYSVFTPIENVTPPARVGNLSFEKAQALISEMKSVSSVVLELAATIHWLKEKEKVADWEGELQTRKPTKASPERRREAIALLERLVANTH